MLASGAAALGRTVTLFATNGGCRALLADWRTLENAGRDELIAGRGVAGLDVLREAAGELGVRLIACEAGLRAEAIDAVNLVPGVERCRVCWRRSSRRSATVRLSACEG